MMFYCRGGMPSPPHTHDWNQNIGQTYWIGRPYIKDRNLIIGQTYRIGRPTRSPLHQWMQPHDRAYIQDWTNCKSGPLKNLDALKNTIFTSEIILRCQYV
jgi:hypothetical protein